MHVSDKSINANLILISVPRDLVMKLINCLKYNFWRHYLGGSNSIFLLTELAMAFYLTTLCFLKPYPASSTEVEFLASPIGLDHKVLLYYLC